MIGSLCLSINFNYSICDCFKGFLEAMMHIRKRTSNCIKFRKKESTDKGYVDITSFEASKKRKGGCRSKVGYTGKPQELNLAKSRCFKHRIIVHELMHALGFLHEQTRHDRDGYVTIVWGNIKKDKYGRDQSGNFKKRSKNIEDTLGTPYDYCSIMHYGSATMGKVDMHPNLKGLIA